MVACGRHTSYNRSWGIKKIYDVLVRLHGEPTATTLLSASPSPSYSGDALPKIVFW